MSLKEPNLSRMVKHLATSVVVVEEALAPAPETPTVGLSHRDSRYFKLPATAGATIRLPLFKSHPRRK